jgi:hypothetical protein
MQASMAYRGPVASRGGRADAVLLAFRACRQYAIAFISPKPSLIPQVVEMDSRDSALRFFFNQS